MDPEALDPILARWLDNAEPVDTQASTVLMDGLGPYDTMPTPEHAIDDEVATVMMDGAAARAALEQGALDLEDTMSSWSEFDETLPDVSDYIQNNAHEETVVLPIDAPTTEPRRMSLWVPTVAVAVVLLAAFTSLGTATAGLLVLAFL